ncbi:hypothetical protein [uncultured Corynebacterium sp.]|uniref:hypothetical protein n=1 Tax=uncultured Corynebacterium sp. TaxID=159447 RepID=UPI0025992AEC|nr:hypothetical protein [uncultured Corynebacterium sp.]
MAGSPDDHRKKLVWESLVGFFGFFTFLALIQGVWNLFQPEPALMPSVILLVLLGLLALAWKGYSRYR